MSTESIERTPLKRLLPGNVPATRLAAVLLALIVSYVLTATDYAWPVVLSESGQQLMLVAHLILLTGFIYKVARLNEVNAEKMLSALEAEKTELQLVLDNVGQGFLTVNPEGQLLGKHSAVVDRWFGPSEPGTPIWKYLGGSDSTFEQSFARCWSLLEDGVMPPAVVLDQLPRRLDRDGKHLRVEYRPLTQGDTLQLMVLVITDVTELVSAERAESAQREFATVLDNALRDRFGFGQFMEEAAEQLEQLEQGRGDPLRTIHTLKGSCGLLGVRSVAEHCHELETRLAADLRFPSSAEVAALRAGWDAFARRIYDVLEAQTNTLEVSEHDVFELREAIAKKVPYATLDRMLRELEYEPAARTLGRFAARARALGQRLGKGEVDVVVESDPIRLSPKQWRAFWSSFTHAVRNAIDHGLESPAERHASGKAARGKLRLAVRARGTTTVIELQDDGRGIDWDRVQTCARERGLPHATRSDLVTALLAHGLSTRADVTETSGRGAGMGALAQAARQLGGNIEIDSTAGRGTILRIAVPNGNRLSVLPPAAPSN